MGDPTVIGFLKELRRRRVFRVAGLYVVAIWLVMQVADIVFPAWGIPDAAIRYLLWAALLGFPVALVFGWIFEVSPEGIRRTQPVASQAEMATSLPLRRTDYLILSAIIAVIGLILYDATGRVIDTASFEEWRPSLGEISSNSVAVLPFASLSSDPEHEFFADGISEEILNRLSAFGELKVIARTSSFAFKDSGYDIARMSRLLGVQYLLQGSVRRDGPQLRITAQLVDRSGVQVWSNTFDRQLGAIFALQDDIAGSVAASILPQIVPAAAAERLPDLDAYEHYLVGREMLAKRTSFNTTPSVEHLSRAIELDPEFAEPYVERAIARTIGLFFAKDLSEELDRAQQDIDTALELKPDLARAYAAQALLLREREPQGYVAREAILRRALALDPTMVDALNWLADALSVQGRHAESEEALRRAARIDPLAPAVNANLARHEVERGRFDEAERRLLRLLEVPQPSQLANLGLAGLYVSIGRLVDAVEVTKRHVLSTVTHTGRPAGMEFLVLGYGRLGLWQSAEYWRDRAVQIWPEDIRFRLMRAYILSLDPSQPGHEEAWSHFRATSDAAGVDPAALLPAFQLLPGIRQALAGDHAGAIRTLEHVIDPQVALQGYGFFELDARHALAWAWLQTGAPKKAMALLHLLDGHYSARETDGRLHETYERADFARNTLLLGDVDAALELLGQAADAGWRDYYSTVRDPRWASVKDDPRFVEILNRVKADIDLQRARMEGIDAQDDYVARLDAAMALKRADEVTQTAADSPQNR